MTERLLLIVGATVVLTAYLCATAPPPLADETGASAATIPIRAAFDILARENDVARALYTEEIVAAGGRAGLDFAEDWRRPGVDAGPLPALFLRSTASALERSRSRLGLFLGSDAPISTANGFSGRQQELFRWLRAERQPQSFYDPDTLVFTAMYPDVAVAAACVTCHNAHAASPRTDWQLGDVMGATTWTYPKKEVSMDELLELIGDFRTALRTAYAAYVSKTESFSEPPIIGARWPRDGRFLPDVQVFMTEIEHRSSAASLTALLALSDTQRSERPTRDT